MEWQLVADCVEKLENRGASKIPQMSQMVQTGDQTKMGIYADFTVLLQENEWCCQTGLNCRPLHYQWRGWVLEISRRLNHLSDF
jgi:hypothetical protein